MNCEQYQENISQFIDGELESANESNLFQHLSACHGCRAFLKEALSLRSELLSNAAPMPSTKLDLQMRQTLLGGMQLPYEIPPDLERSLGSRFLPIAISVITIVLLWVVLILPAILLQNANDQEAKQSAHAGFMMKTPGHTSPGTVHPK